MKSFIRMFKNRLLTYVLNFVLHTIQFAFKFYLLLNIAKYSSFIIFRISLCSVMMIFFIFNISNLGLLSFFSCLASLVIQFLSCIWLFETSWTAACKASLFFTISQSFLWLMSIESVTPSNHLIFCCPLLLLPSIFPRTGVFSNESALCIRRPKYWSFSFSINSSNEYSGLISFRINWFDLLAVQGTLKSLL